MSEELLQKQLIENPEKIGRRDFYNIGATTLKSLKENKIIPDVDYKHLIRKKPDALLVNKQKVIVIIEHKTPAQFKTELQKRKAIEQELEVAKAIRARIFIVTDTKNTLWINPLTGDFITDENGNIFTYKFDHKDPKIEKEIQKILDSINDKNSQIKPRKFIDPTPLAKQIRQDIRTVAGATPENCLYTFVEFFIFKYLSDLGVLTGMYSFDSLLKMYETNTEKEVLEYYVIQIRKKIKADLFPKGKDGTTIINGTIFVSKEDTAVEGYSTVFKKILERFQKYGKLEYIDHDFKSKLFESFLKESISKKNWGQFFTPLKVVKAIVKMAEIKEGMVIGDPACGVGKFLLEPVLDQLHKFYKITNENKLESKITLVGYDKGFDKDEQKTIILAKANMLIYFSDLIKENPSITKEFAELFNETFTLKTNSILGTLRDREENKYDLIFTNPPYVTSGVGNLREEIKKVGLDSYYTTGGQGIEGLFIEWIIKALKPGGKAFIVVPDGFLIRQNDRNLRKYLLDECYLDAIISLPLKTFFTTNKKTYILTITKKHDKQVEKQVDPIFTYLVSEIGETLDINRFDDGDNHLEAAVDLYNQFIGLTIGRRNVFAKMNIDPRCKLKEFEKFDPKKEWSVDRRRSNEEKIALGIQDENSSTDIQGFCDIIQGISQDLLESKEELVGLVQKKKEIKFNEIIIGDLFSVEKGSAKYTKKYGNQNKGKFPVYSASNNEPLTFINKYDYNGKFLTRATNGFAGYMKVIDGKFNINGDRGLLKPKKDDIDINYIKYVLEPILRNLAKGRKGENNENEFTKVYPWMVEQVKIEIPVDGNGNMSLEMQKYLADQYVLCDKLKQQIEGYQNQIKNLKIELDKEENEYKKFKIKDIFEIKKGKALYTNAYITKHKGEFPLFSSQTTDGGKIGEINTYDFDCECITWTTDGIHAGTLFLRNGKFSMTTHCGGLIPKKIEGLDLKYIFYILKQNLKESAVGNMNKRLTKDIMQKLEMRIPIKHDGSFDFKKQKEIAQKYEIIETIKQQVLEKLEQIKNISVSVL